MSSITLTTDFGTCDWFVGTMKGVILGILPRATIVDITHEVPGGNIRAGAFALMTSYSFFPKETVHVAVVDPGVGSRRRAIAVQTAKYFFVGPDNGVLSFALKREQVKSIYALENARYFLNPVSHTFHGRDVFAPVAAHLRRGIPIHKFGRPLKDFVKLDLPLPRIRNGRIEGEIIHVDHFGNLITNIETERLREFGKKQWELVAKRKRLGSFAAFYGAMPAGQSAAVPGSSGFLEIAVNGGSAAERFSLGVGGQVSVQLRIKPR